MIAYKNQLSIFGDSTKYSFTYNCYLRIPELCLFFDKISLKSILIG